MERVLWRQTEQVLTQLQAAMRSEEGMGRGSSRPQHSSSPQGQRLPCSAALEGPLPDASSLNQRGEMIPQGTKTEQAGYTQPTWAQSSLPGQRKWAPGSPGDRARPLPAAPW